MPEPLNEDPNQEMKLQLEINELQIYKDAYQENLTFGYASFLYSEISCMHAIYHRFIMVYDDTSIEARKESL